MPALDVTQLQAAREPFVLLARGSRFVGRPVSAEVMRQHVGAAQDPRPDVALPALRALLRAAFPWRVAYWWRGDPVRIIVDELDVPTQREVLRAFFQCLAGSSASSPPSTPTSPGRSPTSPTPPPQPLTTATAIGSSKP